MTYGQVKAKTLQLLKQYTVAGSMVQPVYNNQQDYLNSIPGLVNDAVMEMATTVRKIPASFKLNDLLGEEHGEDIWYSLPEDFFQFKSGDTVKTEDGRTIHTNKYFLLEKKILVVPKEEVDDYTIVYYRYPKPLSDSPTDKDVIDNTPETHAAIPYYVASFLVAEDNPFLCSLFSNAYEDKLAKMAPTMSAEVVSVEDVYCLNL